MNPRPSTVSADVTMRRGPPSTLSMITAAASVIYTVLSIVFLLGGGLTNLNRESSAQATVQARVDDRLASLETSFNAIRSEINQRFDQERAAREQVDKNSEFRRSTMIDQLNSSITLLTKRLDAMEQTAGNLRDQVHDNSMQSAVLKGLLMQRFQLQNLPGGEKPPVGPDALRPSLQVPPTAPEIERTARAP